MTISATLRRALLFLLITPIVTLLACTSSEGTQKKSTPPSTGKGVPRMTTYPIGRFAIDVPAEMKLVHQWQRLRYAEIEEFAWSGSVPRERARDEAWKKRLTEIGKLTPPKGKERVIIETRDFPGVGAWARGILFYGNRMSPKDGNWLILMDVGQTAAWLELKGLVQYEQDMLHDLTEIAKSYQARRFGDLKLPPGNWFYTEHGVINLPYLEQETAAARFEGHPLEVKLAIKTVETHKIEPEGHGLLGRLGALLATRFAGNVEIKKIRTGKRMVAAMPGEETILRADEEGRKELSFMWRYAGEKDSGEHPKILIEMESADGRIEEKLQIWDAVLNSLKPMYGTGR
ncbi:T6SS immunity protein Tli4 family protein [Geobacter sp. 60473]|nr:T6SS immunity protein Tli4 family protein [Geobacter sp. 60473]